MKVIENNGNEYSSHTEYIIGDKVILDITNTPYKIVGYICYGGEIRYKVSNGSDMKEVLECEIRLPHVTSEIQAIHK